MADQDDVTWSKTETIEVPTTKVMAVNYWVMSRLDLNAVNMMAKIHYFGYASQDDYKNDKDPLIEKDMLVDLSDVDLLKTALTEIVLKIASGS